MPDPTWLTVLIAAIVGAIGGTLIMSALCVSSRTDDADKRDGDENV